jgi:hypothetical protein
MTSKNYDAEETFVERHALTVLVLLVVTAVAVVSCNDIVPQLRAMLTVF